MKKGSNSEIIYAPKAELHVHLEGSISVETLNRLGRKKGLPVFEESPYRFSTFKEFDALFPALGPYFNTPEDFYEIAVAFGKRLIEENIIYCEVAIMPYVHVRRGLDFADMMNAVVCAFENLERKRGINVQIICAIPRTVGPEAGHKTLDWIEKAGMDRIVGIDLAGEERMGTIEAFAPVFDRARAMGLGTVAHAGEFLGPDAIWETLQLLKPHRIGHGISAVTDANLLEYLARKNIPLDISITSNLRLEVISRLDTHPVRVFYEGGVPITINTDDPGFFRTSLIREYEILADQFSFNKKEIMDIIYNGFKYRLWNRPVVTNDTNI